MSAESKVWPLREDLKKSPRVCRTALSLLQRKHPEATVPQFSVHDEIISVVRYWGYRVRAALTGVRKDDDKEKPLFFSKDLRDPEVPLHVEPLVVLERDSLSFSIIGDSSFDFSRLHDSLQGVKDCEMLELALKNFFNWAAGRLSDGAELDGFTSEVRIERFKVADHVVFRHDGSVCGLWVNCDTDEVWEDVPEIGECEKKPSILTTVLSFMLPCVGFAGLFWLWAVNKNIVTIPPVVPEVAFGLACIGALVLIGVFLRGWMAKIVGAVGVIVSSWVLVPWLGEAWDMNSELMLLSPFLTGELAGAPLAAVYIAGSIVLTLLALVAAPSLALRVGSLRSRAAMAVLLAGVTSPLPKSIAFLPDIPTQVFRVSVLVFGIACLSVVGQCGLVLSALPDRKSGVDDMLAKVARIMRPSRWIAGVFLLVLAILAWSQLRIIVGR